MEIQKSVRLQAAKSFYEKHELRFAIGFFLGGFLFDIVTLSDPDDPWNLGKQLLYLGVIFAILARDFLTTYRPTPPKRPAPKWWNHRELLLHFLLGSLLSEYSLFYLKSASLLTSFAFVGTVLALLVANELHSVQQSGFPAKFALFGFCVFSYCSMLAPMAVGFVGRIPFAMAWVATAVVLIALGRFFTKREVDRAAVRRQLLGPSGALLVFLGLCYGMGWVPPIPLSLPYIGVFHTIERKGDVYHLGHERPWWRFWHHGDQTFQARAGDKVVVFAQVFTPASIHDQIFLRWLWKDAKRGWETSDRIPLTVSGGRKEGYRAYAFKQNYQPGLWQARVETTDEREIGRISFEIVADARNDARVFEIETH